MIAGRRLNPLTVLNRRTKNELSLPPNITPEQVRASNLWGLRAMLDWRDDEVIDLLTDRNIIQGMPHR